MKQINKLYIFLSTYDNYIDRVEKIINDSKGNVSYIYIEEFLKDNTIVNEISSKDVIYFLCNNDLVLDVIFMFRKTGAYIINEKYLVKKITKDKCQLLLKNSKILVPQIFEYENITKKDFPFFCKSKSHAEMVLKVYNMNTLKSFFKKFDINEFYFEKDVVDSNYMLEHKIYYVDGKIYKTDEEVGIIRSDLLELCQNISKVLELEMFSVDLIETKNLIYTIDVNIAPGLWNSRGSRESLLYFVDKR